VFLVGNKKFVPLPAEKLAELAEKEGPERWLPVVGWEGYYDVSNYGRVRSLCPRGRKCQGIGRIKAMSEAVTGVVMVPLERRLNGKHEKVLKSVYRLVMLAFQPIENPDDFEVNHRDGIRKNNFLHNLEWCTELENKAHAAANNLMPFGERNFNCKVTSDGIKELRQRAANGETLADLSIRFGISETHTRNIIRGTQRRKDGLLNP
jgi:hypothetical protein